MNTMSIVMSALSLARHGHPSLSAASHLNVASSTVVVMFALLFVGYAALVSTANRKYAKPWPPRRAICWYSGTTLALGASAWPLLNHAALGFAGHMVIHLLLGMFVPLLLVCAAPVTLLLRALPSDSARRTVRLLRHPWMRGMVHPAIGTIVNLGGMWLLYRTALFTNMHDHPGLYILVHAHFTAAGYLFTASVLKLERWMHDWGFLNRIFWLVGSLAGHAVLSKSIYAFPPPGVPADQAQIGAQLMYYGGDVLEILLLVGLCYQRYQVSWRLKQSS